LFPVIIGLVVAHCAYFILILLLCAHFSILVSLYKKLSVNTCALQPFSQSTGSFL